MIALVKKFLRRHSLRTRTFKLIKGKNDPTTLLLLNANIGEKPKSLQIQERNFLTEDKAKHIYEKVELGDIINISTIKQEIERLRNK